MRWDDGAVPWRGGYRLSEDATFHYRERMGLKAVRPSGRARTPLILGLDLWVLRRCLLLHAGASTEDMDRLAPLPAEAAPYHVARLARAHHLEVFRVAADLLRARHEPVSIGTLARITDYPPTKVSALFFGPLRAQRAEILDPDCDVVACRARKRALRRKLLNLLEGLP